MFKPTRDVRKPPGRYYQQPEGTDIVGKWVATTTYTLPLGLFNGLMDTYFYTKPKGYGPTVYRILFHTIPLVGMSTAFVSTAYIATNLRKKDDRYNYLFGGLAAGSIFGTWVKSGMAGLGVGCLFGLAGMIKKDAVLNNYDFFPPGRPRLNSMLDHKIDLSITGDAPGNWTTGRLEDIERK